MLEKSYFRNNPLPKIDLYQYQTYHLYFKIILAFYFFKQSP